MPLTTLKTLASRLLALPVLATLMWTAPAWSDDHEATDQSSGYVEEVISTATRREEPLQETPVASTVITARQIDMTFSSDIGSMPFLAPNVSINRGLLSTQATPSIRGYTLTDVDSTFDPPVATMVNGVYYARPTMNNLDMFDVESLEILRGPQGTLFGRNTTAGAIQLRTKRPVDEFETSGKVTIGDYGRKDFRGAVNVPIIDGRLNARIAAYSLNSSGWYNSQETANSSPRDIGKDDKLTIRPTLHFIFSDTVDLTLIGEFHRDKSDIRPQKNYSGPARSLCSNHGYCGTPFDELDSKSDDYDADVTDPGFVDIEIYSITGELNWDVPMGTFTLLSNIRDTEETWVYDADGVGAYDMFLVDRRQPHEQFSTELKFLSTAFERFDFVGGVFFFKQEYDLERRTGIGSDRLSAPNPNAFVIPLISITGQEHEAWSIFGEVNFHVTDQLTLTAGGRYTDEKKDFYQQTFGVGTPGARQDYSQSWDNAGPKFAVKYQINDDVMAYASYQKGFKSGGFNGRCGQTATCARPFGPEKVDGYEIGIKSDLFDNRVRANIAAFLTQVEGLQRGRIVPLPPGATNPQETVTDNAADAEMKGIELEITAFVTENLRLDFTMGILDAGYDDFCADINGASIETTVPVSDCGGEVVGFPSGTGTAYIVDTDNSDLAFQLASDLSMTIGATYEHPLGNGGLLTLNANYSYVDDTHTDIGELSLRDSVELLNASISYESPGERYRISVYGTNLTNEIYVLSRTIVPPLFDYRNVSPPRLWGVEFGWNI